MYVCLSACRRLRGVGSVNASLIYRVVVGYFLINALLVVAQSSLLVQPLFLYCSSPPCSLLHQ